MSFDFTVKEFILGNGTGTPTLQFYRRGFNLGSGGSTPSWKDIILSGNTALTLVNAKANGLNYLKLFGGTEQTGTPTPVTPIDIISNNGAIKYGILGKNLLDMANCTDGYYYTPTGVYAPAPDARLSDYIPVKAGVTYTVGLNGLQGGANVRLNFLDTEKNWLSQTVFVANAGIEYAQTITPTQDGFFAFSANFTSSSYIDWNTAQVVQGSYTVETMPEYEPYRTGIYTDGTVETVEVIKNYLSREGETTGQIINSDGTTSANSQYCISAPFQLPAGDYTCTWYMRSGGNRPFSVFECDTNGNIITTQQGGQIFYTNRSENGFNTGNFSINTPKLARASYRNNVEDEAVIDVFGTATAEMLLKVGDYQDVQSVIDGKVTRNVGVKVLNGTEEGWVKTNNSFANPSLIADKKIEKSTLFCSHFQYNSGSTSTILDMCVGCATTTINTYFRYDALSTVEQWKQWLTDQYANGTPVIVVYPLATATIETVTGQPLTIQAGTNIVEITQASIDNLELEVSYKAGVEVTVTEIENSQLDNSVEVTVNG